MNVGLVLSGGGIRGAYEVGIIAGIVEALRLRPGDAAPFSIYAGTSVGAINAAYMVANSHRGDLAVGELIELWRNLSVASHLRLNFRRSSEGVIPGLGRIGRSFIDPRPIELLVRRAASWDRLHDNIRSGTVRALLIAAFDIAKGRTTIFTELAPGVRFAPSKDPRRNPSYEAITPDHVLASAAIPLLFPARKIGDAYYCDGGVRFNTPMAPAIRAGADKLVVISLQAGPDSAEEAVQLEEHPSPLLIVGKLLNALLLDPFMYDIEVLARFNRLVHALENFLDPEEMERLQQVLIETRGAPYRRLEPLVFMPSRDIGRMAGEHLRRHLDSWDLSRIPRFLLRRASQKDATWEADWAAYLLFDGAFAERLIDLGLKDARARAEEIRAFFARGL